MHDITQQRRVVKAPEQERLLSAERRERAAVDQLFDMMKQKRELPIAVLEQRPEPRVKLRSDRPKSLPPRKALT